MRPPHTPAPSVARAALDAATIQFMTSVVDMDGNVSPARHNRILIARDDWRLTRTWAEVFKVKINAVKIVCERPRCCCLSIVRSIRIVGPLRLASGGQKHNCSF